MTEGEIGWMAGLFEGEGNIDQSKRSRSCSLRIAMTDLDVLEKFQSLSGCGTVVSHRPPKRSNHAHIYLWRVGNKQNVERLLRLFLPYFGKRRRTKALETLEILSLNKGVRKYDILL